MIVAGPCSAETREQVLRTARLLAERGCRIFRAGVWKPRTKPGGFEGVGADALPWLQEVKRVTGMRVATEVATPEHVDQCLRHDIDILWIGARTSSNPFAVQALADSLQGVDVPVMVKNPVSPDIDLWIGAIERIYQAGVRRMVAVHRGFYNGGRAVYRNLPMWQVPIELRRRLPGLPILCDPSHIGGRRSLVAPLCQQAMDLGFDGLIVESHCAPDEAWSDAFQQVTPEALYSILHRLVLRDTHEAAEGIRKFRMQIDEIDAQLVELLGRRMQVSKAIGAYKRQHNMAILQPGRYNEIMESHVALGETCGMDGDFVRRLFEEVHEESVRQQLDTLHSDVH